MRRKRVQALGAHRASACWALSEVQVIEIGTLSALVGTDAPHEILTTLPDPMTMRTDTRAHRMMMVPLVGILLWGVLAVVGTEAHGAPLPAVAPMKASTTTSQPDGAVDRRGRVFVYRQEVVVPEQHRAWAPRDRYRRGRRYEVETQFRVQDRRGRGRAVRLDIHIEAIRVYRGPRVVLEASRLPRSMRTVRARWRPHRPVDFHHVLTMRPAPRGAYLMRSDASGRRGRGRTRAVVHVDRRTGHIRPVRHRLHGGAASVRVELLPTQARWWHRALRRSRSPQPWQPHREPVGSRWQRQEPPTGQREHPSPEHPRERAQSSFQSAQPTGNETTGGV